MDDQSERWIPPVRPLEGPSYSAPMVSQEQARDRLAKFTSPDLELKQIEKYGAEIWANMSADERQFASMPEKYLTIITRSALYKMVKDSSHPYHYQAVTTLDMMINGKPRTQTELTGAGGAPLQGPVVYLPHNGRDIPRDPLLTSAEENKE